MDKSIGSVETQINNLTKDIKRLSDYIKINKKDYATKRSLYRKVSQRKSLLSYLEKNDVELYNKLVKKI